MIGLPFGNADRMTAEELRHSYTGIYHKTFFKVLSDRKFYPYLDKKDCPYIEDAYKIRVEFNNGNNAQVWTFDELRDWAKDRKLPRLYDEVLKIAIALEADKEDRV